jgi:hypothetical protein
MNKIGTTNNDFKQWIIDLKLRIRQSQIKGKHRVAAFVLGFRA